MDQLRAERVAEVVAARPDGTRLRGSGYLVATGVVLTAAHVLRGAETVVVRFNPDRDDEWSAPARPGWFGPGRTDAALLELEPGPHGAPPEAEPVPFGAPEDDDAVLTCTTAGFPLFKMRQRPDGSQARDLCHAQGRVPVLSNRRTATLEFRVPPPGPGTDASPWQGMSGAAVWAEGHVIGIVVEHHRAEGPGTLTVSRADGWAGTPGEPDGGLLRRAGLDLPPRRIGPPYADVRVADGYRSQANSIAPAELLDREAELAEVVRFCAGPGGYQWWQAAPWHGKTAFAAWLAARPPAGVAVAAFFVSRRDAGQCDSDAFARAMTDQLAVLAGEKPVQGTAPGTLVREWHRLLEAAARRHRDRGRLLVIVDGLDEDFSRVASPPRPSIASLLPRRLPQGVSVLVTSRPRPGPPADLPGDHPLRDCVPRPLSPSPHATRLRYDAEHELGELLAGDTTERQVVGLLTAAGEGLSRDELCALTGMPARRLDELTGGPLARSLAERTVPVFLGDTPRPRTVLVLAHDTLLTTATRLLGDELPELRERMHRWADTHREHGWPPKTPHFLLSGYGRLVLASAGPRRIARVLADPVRHDRMASRLLGDGPALAELSAARTQVAQDRGEDGPGAAVLLAAAHDRLLGRSAHDDGASALLRAQLGHTDRAVALAEAMPDGEAKCRTLTALADRLATAEPRRARSLAEQAVALVHDAPPSAPRSGPALIAVQAGGVLMRLGSPEGGRTLHWALALVAADGADGREPPDGDTDASWWQEVFTSAAESFGAAGDLAGVSAVLSACGQPAGPSPVLMHALTAFARRGHRAPVPRTAPYTPDWRDAVRAAWPAALAAAGAGEDAWRAVDDVPPAHRDRALAALGEAFLEADDLAGALRAARTVTRPGARRRALLDLVPRASGAREGLRLLEEACPHGIDTAAPAEHWPCGGACAALRVRALGTLERWDEALAVSALPHPARFRGEVRRQTLTALVMHGRWQQARDLLARYRAEDEPEHWIRAAVSLVYCGSATGVPEAPELAVELLAALPEPLPPAERSRLQSVALGVLAESGRWQDLARYGGFLAHMLPGSPTLTDIADAAAASLARHPERRAEVLDALGTVMGPDASRLLLAPACARRGQWRTAVSLTRQVVEPWTRRRALTDVAAALHEHEPQRAVALADEAESITPVARPDRYATSAERQRILLGYAEALAAVRPALTIRAARAARTLRATEDLRGRWAVALARASDTTGAVGALGELTDRSWRRRIWTALVAAALTAGRPDEARRLVTDLLASDDVAAVPECLALIAAAGVLDPQVADAVRQEAVRWAADRIMWPSGTVECLTAVLEHCPTEDPATVSLAVPALADALNSVAAPGTVLPLAARAALALEPVDPRAAARFADRALVEASALDPTRAGVAPATAVAGATAVLGRLGALPAVPSRGEARDLPPDVRLVLLAGIAAATVPLAPDRAAAQAEEAAGLLRDYGGHLAAHPTLAGWGTGLAEPVRDCLTVTARALAALEERAAAEALLHDVRSPWQRDLVRVHLARSLAAEAERPGADSALRDAADWALRGALAGDHWYEALNLLAARAPDAVAEACALTLDAPDPPPVDAATDPAGAEAHPVGPSFASSSSPSGP
ncbi:trypsin-like peptidase domain-containing protein [Streptomyces sp. NPDC001811]